ncbi:putative proton-dependent oligopeptide transporter family, major facilitator superfamily [Lupinus albus]|uniref:Putative proton-dependent oligopeptide transporter family, major facilitator superfamily n=1 Tax=Lupinus albus TaxID=3870 RepID=A0A6A4P2D9_LUPAL|nr:putative proton-dependent oligopeptide transporter family, major facilitator superfamily [Lupinus albus]
MELEAPQVTRWEGYVDWKNKPALRTHHGGMVAASFVLVVEVLENLAFLANSSNLVLYMREYMNMSPSKSANNVTNFIGTAFLLALLGGFLSDSLFTTYHIYLISALIEFMGLIVLTIQAHIPSLKPPECDKFTTCVEVNGGKAAMLFSGLYLVALGVGGIKGSLAAHGGEQFDETTPNGRKQRSTFFNYFVFCLSCGALIAVTFVVWIEDNKGWEWGFAISTISIFVSIPVFLAGSPTYRNKIPSGSPLTTILKVLVTASLNSCIGKNSGSAAVSPSNQHLGRKDSEKEIGKPRTSIEKPSATLKFLNNAVVNEPLHSSLECNVQQVEDVKVVLKVLPIFGCTIMLNCCLAQLSTFSVEQAATMNTKLGSLKVPPASLPVFPVVFIMILAPIYDHIIIPYARKATKSETGITHLQRIGIGLVLSIVAMAVAAIVEVKRKRVASQSRLLDDATKPLPITFFWIAFQYLFLGSADLFTLAGLLEFFFSEAPIRMRSLATSLSWASLAMGYYLSSVIVSIVNTATGSSNHRPWLSGANINHYHLERFYWLMCLLSGLNFLHYLFWAIKYKYRGIATNH